jgi:hypothetical protein
VDIRRVDLGHGKSCRILGLTQVSADDDHSHKISSESGSGWRSINS